MSKLSSAAKAAKDVPKLVRNVVGIGAFLAAPKIVSKVMDLTEKKILKHRKKKMYSKWQKESLDPISLAKKIRIYTKRGQRVIKNRQEKENLKEAKKAILKTAASKAVDYLKKLAKKPGDIKSGAKAAVKQTVDWVKKDPKRAAIDTAKTAGKAVVGLGAWQAYDTSQRIKGYEKEHKVGLKRAMKSIEKKKGKEAANKAKVRYIKNLKTS